MIKSESLKRGLLCPNIPDTRRSETYFYLNLTFYSLSILGLLALIAYSTAMLSRVLSVSLSLTKFNNMVYATGVHPSVDFVARTGPSLLSAIAIAPLLQFISWLIFKCLLPRVVAMEQYLNRTSSVHLTEADEGLASHAHLKMTVASKRFGKTLTLIRVDLAITLDEMIKQMAMIESSLNEDILYQIESGQTHPTWNQIIAIVFSMECLKCSPSDKAKMMESYAADEMRHINNLDEENIKKYAENLSVKYDESVADLHKSSVSLES